MKTVLITGATGLIGRELVRHFLDNSWAVIACSRKIEKLNMLDSNVKNHRRLYKIELDLLNDESIDSAINKLNRKGINVSHLVNGARSLDTLKVDKYGISSEDCIVNEIRLGVISPYVLINKLIACSHKLESIVNLSSQYGLVAPNPNLYTGDSSMPSIGYGVSKAALNHLTKEMAVRLQDKNIRVNAIAFGGFQGRANDDFAQAYAKMLPLKRMLLIKEACGPVEFLLDSGSSSVNGHVLVADGGWTIT